MTALSAHDIRSNCWKSQLENMLKATERLYVSIDIDVQNPDVAPGTSFTIPYGLSLGHVLDILAFLRQYPLLGADIVEFNPLLDKNNQTLVVASEVLAALVTSLCKGEENESTACH
nr:arginase family protein [Thermosporothrix hazakensis]